MNNILLFMTDFYGYHKSVISELQKKGNNVTWLSDKIKLNGFQTVLGKIGKQYLSSKFNEYFEENLKSIKDKRFDRIIIIFGAVFMRKHHLDRLRETFPGVEITYYAWDNVKNFPHIAELFEASDLAFTFDKNDSIEYHVNFLPLFYTKKEYKSNGAVKFDVSTVTTFFVEKEPGLRTFLDSMPSLDRCCLYLRIRNRFYLVKTLLLRPKIYWKYKEFFQTKPLAYDDVLRIFSDSKAVLDLPLPNQNGLTMRTFEVLSLGTKLITTNSAIEDYDFYNESNVYLIGKDTRTIHDFLEIPFDNSKGLSDKYSISSFVDLLLGNVEVKL